MKNKKRLIVLTDSSLQKTLRELHAEPEFLITGFEGLRDFIGKADIFFLDDDNAVRFLNSCSDEKWPSVVVTVKDGLPVPSAYNLGLADDILTLPPRALDLERVLRNHEYVQALRDLEESSHGVAGLVRQLQGDIQLAQKVQRRLIRDKFSPIGPLSVKSKYWCGLKSGGDYFDVFEFPGNTHAGFLISDSSSYSLSTSLMSSLMQFSLHVAQGDLGHPDRIVQALFGKLKEGMKEKEKLSLLYGVLDRKTYCLKYVDCGNVYLARRGRDGKVSWGARGDQAALSLEQPKIPPFREISLEPGDRLLACSDGWAESLGEDVFEIIEGAMSGDLDAQEIVNDLAFRMRKKLEQESEEEASAEADFPMPPQDCSLLIFDLAPNVLRLAR